MEAMLKKTRPALSTSGCYTNIHLFVYGILCGTSDQRANIDNKLFRKNNKRIFNNREIRKTLS